MHSVKKISSLKCELRVPNVEDIESVCQTIMFEEDGYLNYDEYLIMLFKVTLDNFGE